MGVNPTGNESEQEAGIGHDASHCDRHERRTTTKPGRLAGFFDWDHDHDHGFTVVADERYAFIARTVKRVGYGRLKRADKAVALRFPERVSGYSR